MTIVHVDLITRGGSKGLGLEVVKSSVSKPIG